MSNPDHIEAYEQRKQPPTDRPPNGWIKLWHPKGPQVTLPVLDPSPSGSLAEVAALLDAGWLVQAPGLEEGEEKQSVGWVCRKTKDSRSGISDVLKLYADCDHLRKPFLTVYLDDDDARAAFEFASKMRLAALPEYVGEGALERGKSANTDRMIVRVPKPFGVVYHANPKYDEAEAARVRSTGAVYPVAKLKFLRWAEQKPAGKQEAEPAPAEKQLTAQEEGDWNSWIAESHTAQRLDETRKELQAIAEPWRGRLKDRLRARAQALGFAWDQKQGRFVGSNQKSEA